MIDRTEELNCAEPGSGGWVFVAYIKIYLSPLVKGDFATSLSHLSRRFSSRGKGKGMLVHTQVSFLQRYLPSYPNDLN